MICRHCGLPIVSFGYDNKKKEEFPKHNWIHSERNIVFCVNAARSRESREKFRGEAAEPSREDNVMALLKKVDEV